MNLAGSLSTIVAFPCARFLVNFSKKKSTSALSGLVAMSAGFLIFIAMIEMFSAGLICFENYFLAAENAFSNGLEEDATECLDACAGNNFLLTTVSFFLGAMCTAAVDWYGQRLKTDHLYMPAPTQEPKIPTSPVVTPVARKSYEDNVETSFVQAPDADNEQEGEVEKPATINMDHMTVSGYMIFFCMLVQKWLDGLQLLVYAVSGTSMNGLIGFGICLHNVLAATFFMVPAMLAYSNAKTPLLMLCALALAEMFGAFCGWFSLSGGLNQSVRGFILSVNSGLLTGATLTYVVPAAIALDYSGSKFSTAVFSALLILSFTYMITSFGGYEFTVIF